MISTTSRPACTGAFAPTRWGPRSAPARPAGPPPGPGAPQVALEPLRPGHRALLQGPLVQPLPEARPGVCHPQAPPGPQQVKLHPRLGRLLGGHHQGPHAPFEADQEGRSGVEGRVLAPGPGVGRAVLLESGVERGHHPLRTPPGEEAHRPQEVGGVAEEHRPPPAQVGHDAGQAPQVPRLHPLQGPGVGRLVVAGVVDQEVRPGPLHGLHDAVGVLQGAGQGLLAEDAPGPGGEGRQHRPGVVLVRRGHPHQVERCSPSISW